MSESNPEREETTMRIVGTTAAKMSANPNRGKRHIGNAYRPQTGAFRASRVAVSHVPARPREGFVPVNAC